MHTQSLEQLIRLHGEELLRLAYTYVKNHTVSEDIVQDVLLKAFEKQSDFRGDSSYRTYLFRLTINRSNDYLRSWGYKNTILTNKIQKIFQGGKSAEQQMIAKSENKLVGEAVLDLQLAYREIIVLYYYKEMKIDAIAELLCCSPNTVKTRLRRGREKLKLTLEGSGIHERFTN